MIIALAFVPPDHITAAIMELADDLPQELLELLGWLEDNETGSRSPCMRPRSDPPKMKNSTLDKIVAEKKKKKKKTKRNGW